MFLLTWYVLPTHLCEQAGKTVVAWNMYHRNTVSLNVLPLTAHLCTCSYPFYSQQGYIGVTTWWEGWIVSWFLSETSGSELLLLLLTNCYDTWYAWSSVFQISVSLKVWCVLWRYFVTFIDSCSYIWHILQADILINLIDSTHSSPRLQDRYSRKHFDSCMSRYISTTLFKQTVPENYQAYTIVT